MTVQLRAVDACNLLRRQVERKGPDHVYARKNEDGTKWRGFFEDGLCLNWARDPVTDQKRPDCIMGHVYADLIPLDLVPHAGNVYNVAPILAIAGVVMTRRALHVFAVAQVSQDRGVKWGDCLDLAWKVAATSHADDDKYMSLVDYLSDKEVGVPSCPVESSTSTGVV